jgi:hypothetical protein
MVADVADGAALSPVRMALGSVESNATEAGADVGPAYVVDEMIPHVTRVA